MKASRQGTLLALSLALLCAGAAWKLQALHLGRQTDGLFLVSSGQRIAPGTLAFDGRPTEISLHPTRDFFAVVAGDRVFLARAGGVIASSEAALGAGASHRGALWSPDGARLYVSVSNGVVQEFPLTGETLGPPRTLTPKPAYAKGNARPGGLALTRDGITLFAAACDRNAVAEIDLVTGLFVREWKTQNLPFAVRLTPDETTLIVSDWGGRLPASAKADGDDEDRDEETFGMQSGGALMIARRNGSAATGTVEIISRKGGATRTVPVGLHPTDIAVTPDEKKPLAYIANAGSDTISVLDYTSAKVTRTIPLTMGAKRGWGAMPCALALSPDGKTLYAGTAGTTHSAKLTFGPAKCAACVPQGTSPSRSRSRRRGGRPLW